jgi:hypothetical protein
MLNILKYDESFFFLIKNKFCELKDEVLGYIDEQFCSRLDGDMKKNCQYMIETNREDLISQIQQGKVRIDLVFIKLISIFSNQC